MADTDGAFFVSAWMKSKDGITCEKSRGGTCFYRLCIYWCTRKQKRAYPACTEKKQPQKTAGAKRHFLFIRSDSQRSDLPQISDIQIRTGEQIRTDELENLYQGRNPTWHKSHCNDKIHHEWLGKILYAVGEEEKIMSSINRDYLIFSSFMTVRKVMGSCEWLLSFWIEWGKFGNNDS